MSESVDIAVGEDDGKVWLRVEKPTDTIVFDPQNALEIGEAMARAAYKARYGKSPQQQESIIGKELRQKLVNRVNLMLISLEQKPKAYQAAQIVDTILAEVK